MGLLCSPTCVTPTAHASAVDGVFHHVEQTLDVAGHARRLGAFDTEPPADRRSNGVEVQALAFDRGRRDSVLRPCLGRELLSCRQADRAQTAFDQTLCPSRRPDRAADLPPVVAEPGPVGLLPDVRRGSGHETIILLIDSNCESIIDGFRLKRQQNETASAATASAAAPGAAHTSCRGARAAPDRAPPRSADRAPRTRRGWPAPSRTPPAAAA